MFLTISAALVAEFKIFFFLILVGVGKTSLVHLIIKSSSIARPPQTIGCTVGVKVRFIMNFLLDSNLVVYY